MSDEETKNKRKMRLRNKHAKELKENSAFRIRRVESDKQAYQRLSTSEWMKRIREKDNNDYDEDD